MKMFSKLKLPVILLLFLTCSCDPSFLDINLDSNATITFPIAHGEYSLDDLFGKMDDVVVVDSGTFYELVDTILFNWEIPFEKSLSSELVLNTINYIPFQLDLTLVSYDSLSGVNTAVQRTITLVEPASINDIYNLIVPSKATNNIGLNEDEIMEADGLVIHANFIWPYQQMALPVISDMPAFDLVILLNLYY